MSGGVIGRQNLPDQARASGVWRLQDLLAGRLGARWPRTAKAPAGGLLDFMYEKAWGGVQGALYNYVPMYLVGTEDTGNFTITTSTYNVTVPEHLLNVGDRVLFYADGGALPSAVEEDTPYYVRQVVDANNFTISATPDGDEVLFLDAGTPDDDRRVWKDPDPGDPDGGYNVEIEMFHFDIVNYPAGLQVYEALRFGEDDDVSGRITVIAVDGPILVQPGGSIGVTNDRGRLGTALISRDNIDVGNGTTILAAPPYEPDDERVTTGYRPWLFTRAVPGTLGTVRRGGNAGTGGPAPSPVLGAGGYGGAGIGGAGQGGGTFGADGGVGAGLFPLPGSYRVYYGGGGGGGNLAGEGGPNSPTPSSFPDFGNPGVTSRGNLILSGRNVTIPESGVLSTRGGNGGQGRRTDAPSPPGRNTSAGGGGGAGGSPLNIFHAGTFVNNGTVTAEGGAGGPAPQFPGPPDTGRPGVPGTAGEVTVAPIPVRALDT